MSLRHDEASVSSLALSVFIIMLTWISIVWIAPRSTSQAWVVGLIWIALTLAFEFLAGHYLFGHPWSRLLEDARIADADDFYRRITPRVTKPGGPVSSHCSSTSSDGSTRRAFWNPNGTCSMLASSRSR